MGGGSATPAPAETPAEAPAEEIPTDDTDLDFGGDAAPADDTTQDTGASDKPFDDEPFDAGVEADEESDPKKFIEQLTGKLGQSLRKYNEDQGQPDFELEKFAVNSLLSATHTGEMDAEDQKDIIKKIKSSGKGDGDEESSDTEDTSDTDETPEERPEDTGSEETPDETSDDSDNLFETSLNESFHMPDGTPIPVDKMHRPVSEMSLNDWKARAVINAYENGSQEIKDAILKKITFEKPSGNAEEDKETFLTALEDDFDNDHLSIAIKELQEDGVDIDVEGINESSIFLKYPKKNNMFQEGSNDVLDEACWKGYKKKGMKTMFGKQYPNCVKVNENEELEEKDDRCTRIAKRKYDTWPSAYASGAVVKCRQGKIWKDVDENYLEELDSLKEKWSQKYKRSIDCNNPKGFSQKAHCQGKKKHG